MEEYEMNVWYTELDKSDLSDLELWAKSIDNTHLMRKADEYVDRYRATSFVHKASEVGK